MPAEVRNSSGIRSDSTIEVSRCHHAYCTALSVLPGDGGCNMSCYIICVPAVAVEHLPTVLLLFTSKCCAGL